MTIYRGLIVLPLLLLAGAAFARDTGCSATARTLQLACGFDTKDDYFTSVAACQDTEDLSETNECIDEAKDELSEAAEECADILEARLDLCDDLDDAAHEPEFGEDYADNFVDPLEIGNSITPNPYFPLIPGNQWVYEGTFVDEEEGEEITETITVTVTGKTKQIDGVTCIVITDVAEEDGEVIEATDDWYAQDLDGNVWYCGEISKNYEYFDGDEPEEAELVDIEGSWKAGRDEAKAGILLPAEPEVGQIFRQELAWTDAEDAVEILDLAGTESALAASCTESCLVTRDFTPLEPDAEENKYYLPGLGLILEIDLETGDRVELIGYTQ